MATSHWTHSAVTNAGRELLNEMMAGHRLNICKAKCGDGKVDAGQMASQTGLHGEKQEAKIVSDITTETGRTVCVQITNADTEYNLSEIGLFAKLDDAGEETLLFLTQDDYPVPIPDKKQPEFILEIYCVLAITNDGRLTITVDGTGVATVTLLRETVKAHNEDPNAHLIKDDTNEGTYYRFGVDNGGVYIQEVEKE